MSATFDRTSGVQVFCPVVAVARASVFGASTVADAVVADNPRTSAPASVPTAARRIARWNDRIGDLPVFDVPCIGGPGVPPEPPGAAPIPSGEPNEATTERLSTYVGRGRRARGPGRPTTEGDSAS